MIVAGVDVSLAGSGVAVAETVMQLDERELLPLLRSQTVKSPPLGSGLVQMSKRIGVAADGILEAVPSKFDLLVIERPLPATGGFASLQLERAAVYWIVVETLLQFGPVCDVHPKTRAKLATGNGNANKHDVLREVAAAFPGQPIGKDHNRADAIVLCAAGMARMGHPLLTYTAEQLKAFGNIEWPNGLGGDVPPSETKEQA